MLVRAKRLLDARLDYAFANREGEGEGNCDSGGGVRTTFSVAIGDNFLPLPWSPESVPPDMPPKL